MAKVLELQFQHQPSNEYSGLISFRVDCFDLRAVQGTLKSLLQCHSSNSTKILALGLKQLKTLEKLSLQLAWVESFSRDLCLPWPLSWSLYFHKLLHFFNHLLGHCCQASSKETWLSKFRNVSWPLKDLNNTSALQRVSIFLLMLWMTKICNSHR